MSFVVNEQVNIEIFSVPELERIITRTPDRVELILNTKNKSDVWKIFRFIRVDGMLVPNLCACLRCNAVFTTSRNAGTSHLLRHQKSCTVCPPSTSTQLSLEQVTKQKFKLAKEESEAIKDSELAICALGYQSFHSLESEGLSKFAQTFVDLGAKRGRFKVSIQDGTLLGRNAVQNHCLSKAKTMQAKLRDTLHEPICSSAVALTTDMWTDNFRKLSYLDVHAFWVSKELTLKHCLLAVEHFGTDSHTGDNILRHFKQITEEYGLINFSAPVVTDKGSNMVSGLRDSPRLDCICHRIHTVFTDAYKETQRQVPEVKKYEDAVASLCKYVKQATGIQETLPVSIKHGGNTRPWTSIYRRAHSIHESYTKLSEKLTERVKLPLLAAVDKELNEQIRDVTEVFNCVFENLQYNTRPTINLVIPSYYKLSAMATHEDLDSLEIATLKQNIHSLLDKKLYSSITQFHWIATIFDPGFKSLSFLPNSTPADRKFKRDLLKDLPGWIETLAHTNSGTTSPVSESIAEAETEEPPQKKRKSFFGSMRSKVQPVKRIGDATLNLQQEYDMYINGGVASDYDEEDPLTFWATVQHRFPLLGTVARHVLCCPATSAQSERDFSHTGLILTSRRSLLSPKYVSSLEFIAAAHRAGLGTF